MNRLGVDFAFGLSTVCRGKHLVTRALQNRLQSFSNGDIIVSDQDSIFHDRGKETTRLEEYDRGGWCECSADAEDMRGRSIFRHGSEQHRGTAQMKRTGFSSAGQVSD